MQNGVCGDSAASTMPCTSENLASDLGCLGDLMSCIYFVGESVVLDGGVGGGAGHRIKGF